MGREQVMRDPEKFWEQIEPLDWRHPEVPSSQRACEILELIGTGDLNYEQRLRATLGAETQNQVTALILCSSSLFMLHFLPAYAGMKASSFHTNS